MITYFVIHNFMKIYFHNGLNSITISLGIYGSTKGDHNILYMTLKFKFCYNSLSMPIKSSLKQ